MLRTTRLTTLAFEPVTLAEAKLHCRVDIADDDALITRNIRAARLFCEEHADATFVGGTFRGFLEELPLGSEYIQVPRPPLVAVSAIAYTDPNGVSQVLQPSALLVDGVSSPGRIYPAYGTTWPSARKERNSVRIDYSAGPADLSGVDERVKQAILLLVSHWYENREALITGTISKELELAVTNILAQFQTGVYH